MTSWYQKRERMEKQHCKLIRAGEYEKADKIRKKIVEMDVERLRQELKNSGNK